MGRWGRRVYSHAAVSDGRTGILHAKAADVVGDRQVDLIRNRIRSHGGRTAGAWRRCDNDILYGLDEWEGTDDAELLSSVILALGEEIKPVARIEPDFVITTLVGERFDNATVPFVDHHCILWPTPGAGS